MLRPLPTFNVYVRDEVRVGKGFGYRGGVDPGFRLQFGINTNSATAGIAFVYTNAPVQGNGATYGRYFLTQVVSNFRQRYNLRTGTNCVGTQLDGTGLDTSNPYDGRFSESDHDEWTDAPGGGLTFASWLMITNSFVAHLMFEPRPYDASTRPVPIYKFDWAWGGSAKTNGPPDSWTLIAGFPPTGIQPVEVQTFPSWSANITNNITTTEKLPCFDEN